MMPIIDYAHEYNADRRRHRLKRRVAHACVLLAFILICLSFGCLIGAADNAAISTLATIILIAGFWGAHFLVTRHKI